MMDMETPGYVLRHVYEESEVRGYLVTDRMYVWVQETVDAWDMVGDMVPVEWDTYIVTLPTEVSVVCDSVEKFISIAMRK